MKKTLLSALAAALLLTGCETKRSETKEQPGETGQDTAVMSRDGQAAGERPAMPPPRRALPSTTPGT